MKKRFCVIVFLCFAVLVLLGCLTAVFEDQFKNDLIGLWHNPEYAGDPYLYFQYVRINPDMTMEMYRDLEMRPITARLTFIEGSGKTNGERWYLVGFNISTAEGYFRFHLLADGSLEYVRSYNDIPGEVDPENETYRFFTRM